jgi:type I restriction enzyme S subunit
MQHRYSSLGHQTPPLIGAYLAFYLRTPSFVEWATTNASGTKMPRIGVSQLKDATVPLPPLLVQERIVAILRRADEIRRKRREASTVSDSILPAIFDGMFGNPADNPKRYRKKTLGEVTELVTSGYTPRGGAANYSDSGPLLIRSQNVRMLSLDLENCAHISEEIYQEMSRVRVLPGDVLLNITGASIGRVTWVDDVPAASVNQHVCIIRADKAQVAPQYLAYCLAMPWYQHIILNSPGSAQTGFNHSRVRALEIFVPPMPIQKTFVSQVQSLQETLLHHSEAMSETVSMLESVMAQAFSGELTAEWERDNAQLIADHQTLNDRLPQLLLLAILSEKAKRASPTDAVVLVTALMKYVFLVQMEGAVQRRLYRFVPYHYGPFAKELYADLESLQQKGLITVRNGEDDKIEIRLADDQGAAQEAAQLPDDLREDMCAVLDAYGQLDHKNLLKSVYEAYPGYAVKSKLRKKHAQ